MSISFKQSTSGDCVSSVTQSLLSALILVALLGTGGLFTGSFEAFRLFFCCVVTVVFTGVTGVLWTVTSRSKLRSKLSHFFCCTYRVRLRCFFARYLTKPVNKTFCRMARAFKPVRKIVCWIVKHIHHQTNVPVGALNLDENGIRAISYRFFFSLFWCLKQSKSLYVALPLILSLSGQLEVCI